MAWWVMGPPFNLQGVGVEYLSLIHYLFQPGSAARWKLKMLSHVYIQQFLQYIIYFMQSLREIIYTKIHTPWIFNGGFFFLGDLQIDIG